ncbi:MAG TPA: tripartite tricarboxylate transporter substrate binding protein [Burkholderiales bacterium]|nr:tripartite tricarboxylate transporter substrate binding protein [Burkholderiales bacterium]
MTKKSLLSVLAGTLACAAIANAQNYPVRPIRAVVPYAAGGLPDTMTRIMSQRMVELLGQHIVVDNRPGAGGISGCELVARASPDGYTVLIADVGQTAINPALYAKLPYDTLRDFAPVSLMGTSGQFLVAHASVPANTLKELIALVRSKPGQLRYGSGGIGSVHHLSMEALKTPLKLDIVHVPYKGAGQAVPALLAGEVALLFAALPATAAHVKAGRLKLLAVNTIKRNAQAPDVPTIAEITGIKDYDYPPAIGVMAPARTPKAVIDRLAAAVQKAVQHPDTVARYTTLGIDPVGNTPAQYLAQTRADIAKYARAVNASGIKVD